GRRVVCRRTPRRGRRVKRTLRLVTWLRARGCRERWSCQREILEAQVRDPHGAATARPCRNRDFDRTELLERPTARRAPCTRHFTAADMQCLPVCREVERVAVPPPDVATARVGELDLELVCRREATHTQRHCPRCRHRTREAPARDDEAAAALEVVLQPK